jgi:transposase
MVAPDSPAPSYIHRQKPNKAVVPSVLPGAQDDVKDAEWIADLLCHGLLRSSFVPPKPIRELRDLTRYRRKLIESRSAERNRLLKLLESANIKLASVATDIFGASGRLTFEALVEGKTTAQEMADLTKKQLRKKIPELELALEGRWKKTTVPGSATARNCDR